MAGAVNEDVVLARFEELSALEAEFEDVELEIIRTSNTLNAPLWKKRAEIIAKIPHFWTLIFEESPQELANFIQPTDSSIFAEALQTLEVSRFEIDDPEGSPRSVSIKFGFGENEYFEDKEIEKKFWFRKSKDWDGLVSEPVKIHWKEGKDPTGGLTDAAYALAQAKKKLAESVNGSADARKEADLPEYKALARKIAESNEASLSFFAWFGFVSSYRWISAEESKQAEKEAAERLVKAKRGEKMEPEEDDGDEEPGNQETEVFPQGDEVVTLIAEDLWPSAIKVYMQTHNPDNDDDWDVDSEDMDEEGSSDDEVDIRGLVGQGDKMGGSPPSKKQRMA